MRGSGAWSDLRRGLRYATEGGVPRRSLRIALIVGAVLTLIHQGDALLATGRLDWVKCLLTFVVPYAVSTYGAVSFRMGAERAQSQV